MRRFLVRYRRVGFWWLNITIVLVVALLLVRYGRATAPVVVPASIHLPPPAIPSVDQPTDSAGPPAERIRFSDSPRPFPPLPDLPPREDPRNRTAEEVAGYNKAQCYSWAYDVGQDFSEHWVDDGNGTGRCFK